MKHISNFPHCIISHQHTDSKMSAHHTFTRVIAEILCAILGLTTAACGNSSTAQSAVAESDRVSVHDPSIAYDKTSKSFYVFGSHRAYATSKDAVHWSTFTNNLSNHYYTILGSIWDKWPSLPTNPNIKGNMWAPDVSYNPVMHKWCMYLALNGDQQKSVIVLLTADGPHKNWKYEGPVVYSGFDSSDVTETDVPRVLGKNADLSRYQSVEDTRIDAIDPCVKWDKDGHPWMSFGSWFGGIYLLRLNPQTGFRDYTVHYRTVPDKSDAYYGHKIAGGYGNSGEGSALMNVGQWWYLFLSYGKLTQTGGYQIRLFRSKSITGPYEDEAGNKAVADMSSPNNWSDTTGIRLLSSYQWPGSSSKHIEVAQGGNSVISARGMILMCYHTRFANTGEMHQIRVRQLLRTANGWLTAAPYEYEGTPAKISGYSHKDYVGTYRMITHSPLSAYNGRKSVNSKALFGVNKPQVIILHADGKVSGTHTGSWSAIQGSNTMRLVLNGKTYEGAFALLPTETTGKRVMTFTAIGQNISIWGTKATK